MERSHMSDFLINDILGILPILHGRNWNHFNVYMEKRTALINYKELSEHES